VMTSGPAIGPEEVIVKRSRLGRGRSKGMWSIGVMCSNRRR
jgi:hypothetical protein